MSSALVRRVCFAGNDIPAGAPEAAAGSSHKASSIRRCAACTLRSIGTREAEARERNFEGNCRLSDPILRYCFGLFRPACPQALIYFRSMMLCPFVRETAAVLLVLPTSGSRQLLPYVKLSVQATS